VVFKCSDWPPEQLDVLRFQNLTPKLPEKNNKTQKPNKKKQKKPKKKKKHFFEHLSVTGDQPTKRQNCNFLLFSLLLR